MLRRLVRKAEGALQSTRNSTPQDVGLRSSAMAYQYVTWICPVCCILAERTNQLEQDADQVHGDGAELPIMRMHADAIMIMHM